jgi:hypothetical protein
MIELIDDYSFAALLGVLVRGTGQGQGCYYMPLLASLTDECIRFAVFTR